MLLELQRNAAALSVAMPNREGRALHARSQDQNTINKLQLKLGQLMAKLQLSDPPAESSTEYKAGLATFRGEELSRTQAELESLLSQLAVQVAERPQQGTASKVTRAQAKSIKRKRKRVRELVGVMQTWQQLDAPSSSAVQQLPAVWGEAEVKQLFTGVYPWRQGPAAEREASLAVLAGELRDACAEVSGYGVKSQVDSTSKVLLPGFTILTGLSKLSVVCCTLLVVFYCECCPLLPAEMLLIYSLQMAEYCCVLPACPT